MSVFPAELEQLLGRHPAVAGSGVVGAPCSSQGEKVVAFVRLRDDAEPGVDEEALIVWCKERIARYKVPEVRLVDDLPLTASGKVKRDVLLSSIARNPPAASVVARGAHR